MAKTKSVFRCSRAKLAWYQRLRRNFNKAIRHFRVEKDAARTAWESAQASPRKAYSIYGAIARSLP